MALHVGTSGYSYKEWKGSFYPEDLPAKSFLKYYAERFDTVEVDSPFYRLPAPETAARWAERTPPGFVFHAKASKAMTGHEETDSKERAFAEFRESLAPLEQSGKLRSVLLQFHPRVKKSPEALVELRDVADLLAPLVPLIEFRHRSWMIEEERADTLAFLEQHGLAYVSVDSPRTRASNVMPRIAAATHDVAYLRFHGRNWKTWNKKTKTSGERFDWLYSREDLEDWVEPIARLAEEAREVYALFNNNRFDYVPRSAQVLRGLLDEAGVAATGGVEPAPTNATLF
jgi:uncharacterized protein YecE (DUF72 family)